MNLFTYEKGYCFVYYLSQLCGDPRHFDSFLRVSVNKHVFLLRFRAAFFFFQVLSLWLIDRGKVEYKRIWDGRMVWACLPSCMILPVCDRFLLRFLLSECAHALLSSQILSLRGVKYRVVVFVTSCSVLQIIRKLFQQRLSMTGMMWLHY